VRGKHCWLVADKPSEQGDSLNGFGVHRVASFCYCNRGLYFQDRSTSATSFLYCNLSTFCRGKTLPKVNFYFVLEKKLQDCLKDVEALPLLALVKCSDTCKRIA
jgi:hypothetical protein